MINYDHDGDDGQVGSGVHPASYRCVPEAERSGRGDDDQTRGA